MFKRLSVVGLGLLIAVAPSQADQAETVMDKVARTGVITFATRTDLIPYSYINDKNQLVGYSADVVEQIRQEAESRTGRPVRVDYKVINDPDEIMRQVSTGEVDLACSTQFTWQRSQFVDYSIPYSLSGIRILIKSNSDLTEVPDSLAGKRVGVIPNSLGETVMKTLQPRAILVPLTGTTYGGFADLQSGKVDAVAGDSVIMAGTLLSAKPQEDYTLVPRQPFVRYGMGCVVPQNNSRFLNAIDRAIATMMQGYISGDPEYVNMVGQWLGPTGLVEVPEEQIRTYFESVILSREQIPLSSPLRQTGNQ